MRLPPGNTVSGCLNCWVSCSRWEACAPRVCTPVLQQGPWACAPEKLALEGRAPLVAVGDGCAQLSRSSAVLRHRVRAVHPELLPHALDVIPLARQLFARGASQTPAEVNPDYVRDEINWKKLSEQGRQQ
mgnify:CR=1 FL=1